MAEGNSPLLTQTQREHLTGDFEELDESQRSRLRDRVLAILNEFAVVNQHLPENEREKLFRKALGEDLVRDIDRSENERDRFYYSLVSLIAFIYQGRKDAGFDLEQFEFLIEDAVAMAESDNTIDEPPTADRVAEYSNSFDDVYVDAHIDLRRKTLEAAIERYESHRDVLDSDIGKLVRSGYLDERAVQRLVEEYSDGNGE